MVPIVDRRRSISTKSPEIGRFDQSELAVTWNSTRRPLPRFAAVTSGVPSLSRAQISTSGVSSAGSASTCRLIVTSAGIGKPANGLLSSKAAKRLRRRPRKRAAKRPAAAAQWHGQKIVAGLLESRTGKADEQTAVLDEVLDFLCRLAGQRADVGEHQHRDVLLQDGIEALVEIGVLGDRQGRRRASAPSRYNRAAPAAAAPPRGFRRK